MLLPNVGSTIMKISFENGELPVAAGRPWTAITGTKLLTSGFR